MATGVLPPNTRFLDDRGNMTREWYAFFVSLTKTADGASAGEIATAPGSGLAGGGSVGSGVSLQIADNGVSNGMLRQSNGTSVIGRSAGTTGNVGDIIAGGDGRVLTRDNGSLAFRDVMNGVAIGTQTPAAVRCTTLRVDTAPATSTATVTHSVSVNLNGTTYYLLASATP